MNRFFCVGISHKTCPVEIREKFAFSQRTLADALHEMKRLEFVRECLILSTCNRVELYGRGDEFASAQIVQFLSKFHAISENELKPYLYYFVGEDVAEHLFRVASGLESMVVGENEIHGQLKQAFRVACENNTVDSVLYQLVERALRVGKKVRTETKISQGAVSVASVAVELAEKIFGKLSGEKVLVVGAGEMSERTIEHLVREGAGKIVVASRNFDRALELAQKFGAEPIRFDEWMRVLRTSDIVISSTAAPHPIIRFEDIRMIMQERRNQPLFLIDIAVPRDIEAAVQTLDDVYLYNIDDLQSVIQSNVRERKREIEKCETFIEREITEFYGWTQQLEMRPTLRWLQNQFDELLEDEINKSKHQLAGKEREVRDLFTRVRKKMFHKPLERLKSAAREGFLPRYLQLIRELFSEELRRSNEIAAEREKQEQSHETTLPNRKPR